MTTTDTDNLNLPPLDTPEQIGAEILWCAREAHELLGSDDEARIEAHRVRRERLLRVVEQSEERVEQAIARGEEPVILRPVAPQPTDEDRGGWCPQWCTKHRAVADVPDLVVTHSTQVSVGEAIVHVDLETHADGKVDPDGTVVWVPEVDWVNGTDLDNLIEALTQARALITKEA